jgi:hypothetical protein
MSEALGTAEEWRSLTPETYAAALKSRLRGKGVATLPPGAIRGLTDDAARDVWYVLTSTQFEGTLGEGEIGHMFVILKSHGVVIGKSGSSPSSQGSARRSVTSTPRVPRGTVAQPHQPKIRRRPVRDANAGPRHVEGSRPAQR